jgi:hypothetical protein
LHEAWDRCKRVLPLAYVSFHISVSANIPNKTENVEYGLSLMRSQESGPSYQASSLRYNLVIWGPSPNSAEGGRLVSLTRLFVRWLMDTSGRLLIIGKVGAEAVQKLCLLNEQFFMLIVVLNTFSLLVVINQQFFLLSRDHS